MIRLHTLGSLDLRGSDGSEMRSVLAQPKRLALLAYLAVHGRQGFVSRDRLLALFWPDHDESRARGALNRAIYYLRKGLGEGVVLSRGDDAIGVSPDAFWCDAVEVEAAAAEGRHGQVVDLYKGDLVEGLQVADAPDFGRWLDVKRHGLKEIASRSAWSLAEAESRNGNYALAVQWARWSLARSPYDEASVRRLMSLLDGAGDRAGAVHEYERLVRRLADELELAPAPETLALVEAIRARAGTARTVGHDVDPSRGQALDLPPVAEGPFPSVRFPAADDSARRRPAIPSASARLRRPGVAVAIAAGALAVAASVVFATQPAQPDAGLIVVAPLANRTGDAALDAFTRSATDLIARDVEDVVASASAIAPMPAARVIRGSGDEGDAGSPLRRERAGTWVSGEIYRERGALLVRARVIDALRGQRAWTIPPIPVRSDATEEAVRELRQRVTGAVAALRNPTLAGWFPVATTPPTYDALEEYLRGFAVTRSWDAGDHFERAWQIDSTFTWARLEAAGEGRMLDRGRAHAIVAELDVRRERLNRLEIAVLDSRVAAEAGDRQARYRALTTAAQLAPERFLREYAMSAWGLHLPRRTLELLDRADAQRPAVALPANWSMRTELLHELGDHRVELALARRARAALPRDLSALSAHVRALAGLGEAGAVLALVDTALSTPAETFYSPGTVMLLAVDELRAHGKPVESAQLARRAVDWYRKTPPTFTKGYPSWHEMYLATALYQVGDWSEAQALYRELLEREPVWRVEYYGSLGAIAARRGDRAEAEAYLTALSNLDVPNEAQPEDVGRSRARIAVLLGDTDRALAFLREGFGGGQGVDLHAELDFQAAIADDPGFREFVRPKG